MPTCAGCGRDVEAVFRFCPWCGGAQRRKLVEFFRAHPRDVGRALRVSRYFGDDPQVRFSVWEDGVARAAISLDEDEARRLAGLPPRYAPVEPGEEGEDTIGAVLRDAGAELRDAADEGVGGLRKLLRRMI